MHKKAISTTDKVKMKKEDIQLHVKLNKKTF